MAPLILASARTPNTSESSRAAEPTPPSNRPCTRNHSRSLLNNARRNVTGPVPEGAFSNSNVLPNKATCFQVTENSNSGNAKPWSSAARGSIHSSFSDPRVVSGEVVEKAEVSIWWHWKRDLTLLKEGKSHFWLKQAENEESSDPDVPTKARERFLSHGRAQTCLLRVPCCSLHKAWAHTAPSTCTKQLLQFSSHSWASWKHS